MKIILKTRAAGPDYRGNPGDEIDLPPKIAMNLVETGHAEPAGDNPRSAASKIPTRKAVRPTVKR